MTVRRSRRLLHRWRRRFRRQLLRTLLCTFVSSLRAFSFPRRVRAANRALGLPAHFLFACQCCPPFPNEIWLGVV
ncbi:uncharacterized protein J3D65DRAFT_621809 [Phyllosticta citribraziliensis]|uniref:Secreted protein n=1 Tax=Phyllosticta citribraziliensis TaxID=989973 RepID=A0ABR1LV40_9PEZI